VLPDSETRIAAALTGDTVCSAAPHVFTRDFEGELVILDLAGGDYFGLDSLGLRVWEGLLAGQTTNQIARAVAPEYDTSLEVLEADLLELVRELLNRKLVVVKV
jgi:hypothetical protein